MEMNGLIVLRDEDLKLLKKGETLTRLGGVEVVYSKNQSLKDKIKNFVR